MRLTRNALIAATLCLLSVILVSQPSSSPRLETLSESDACAVIRAQSVHQVINALFRDITAVLVFGQWQRPESPSLRVEYTQRMVPILSVEHFLGRSELPVVETFEWLLRQERYDATDSNTLILDVGANTGFFSSMAGLIGFRVIAFEPQPGCIPWIALHAHRNRVADRVCIVNAGVGNIDTSTIRIVPTGCNAGYITADQISKARVDGANATTTPVDSTRAEIPVVNLGAFLADTHTVPVVKIDTEGAEIGVLESLDVALREHRVRNLLVELAPHVWSNLLDGYAVLHRIIFDYGFLLKVLDDGDAHQTKVVGVSPFGQSLSHVMWYDVPDLLAYLKDLAQVGQGDNVLLTLDFMRS